MVPGVPVQPVRQYTCENAGSERIYARSRSGPHLEADKAGHAAVAPHLVTLSPFGQFGAAPAFQIIFCAIAFQERMVFGFPAHSSKFEGQKTG